jgi:hypothetical protein
MTGLVQKQRMQHNEPNVPAYASGMRDRPNAWVSEMTIGMDGSGCKASPGFVEELVD